MRIVPRSSAVSNHVVRRARMKHAHGNDRRVDGVLVPRGDGLTLQHHRARERHRIDAQMRLRRVRTLARHRDPEARAGGHDRAGAQPEMPGRQPGPVVHAEYRFRRELLEQPVVDHPARARAALFARLKHEMDGAGQLRQLLEHARGAEQHHGMAVMAARMHDPVRARRIREVVGFVDRQRVQIGAQHDAAARIGTGQARDHARATQPARHRVTERFKLAGDDVGRPVFLESQLGMRMQVSAQLRPVRTVRVQRRVGDDGVFQSRHPCKANRFKSRLPHRARQPPQS